MSSVIFQMSLEIDVDVSQADLNSLDTDRRRPQFTDGWICQVSGCDPARTYSKFLQYMRHWRKYHVPMTSVVACSACQHHEVTKPDLRLHLVQRHNYTPFHARRAVDKLERVKVMNSNFRNPGDVLPPVRFQEQVATLEIEESIVDVLEVGESVPRDMDVEMVEKDGQLVFVTKKRTDFKM